MPEEPSLGEQNYREFARRYAEIAKTKPHNAYYDRPNTLSLLPQDLRHQQVLDAGCGPGIYAEELLKRGADVVAFDVTPEFVEITRERVSERATVLQADLSQPLHFAEDSSFDLVLCPLVLDYIEDWAAVFREFARVLKPGGLLVFSNGHPMGDWQYLKRRLPEIAQSYFETQRFTTTWGGFGDPAPEITSYRRPLAAMLNPLIEAGFCLDHVLEPVPTPDYEREDPQGYAELLREPGFICIRARKA
jgi:SAM-dependent methyltransferase